jgi:NADPH-dependent curcumin reductase CurA
MATVNRQFRLAARPVGLPARSTWNFTEEPLGEPMDGQILVKVFYISLDPAMRGWMNEGKSYIPPVGIGEVMRAVGAGKVIASKFPGIAVGDFVSGMLGVQEYSIVLGRAVNKIDAPADALPLHIGGLGLSGMTAYFGLLDVGRPEPGNTVVVSGAAGAVGAIAGQIAKIKGCRVVGIAGGPEKCGYLTRELGFDAAIDYKSEDVGPSLRKHCPKGIDVFFDNVGGDILDAALANLAPRARIVICGAISQYNNTTPIKGPSNYLSLLVNRASMIGMVVSDYFARMPEARAVMAEWIKEGKLKTREHIVEGLETFPESLLMLFRGQNNGKLMIRAATEASFPK